MIGVILWSDAKERKAVVWCEDHGDLAFLGCGDAQVDNLGQLATGDILEFDVEIDGNFRRVKNPTLIKSYSTGDLENSSTKEVRTTETPVGELVAFPSPTPADVALDVSSNIAM